MEEWKKYKLGDVVNVLDYKRVPLSSKERSLRQGIYPYYGAQGIIDYVNDYIFDGTYLLIAEDGENLKSKKQNIAQLATGKYWVNNHAHIAESNGKSDIRFIYYLLNIMDVSGYITGSAQPKLNQANLLSISIKLPSLQIQKSIANFLSVFDNKIEVNRRINDNFAFSLLILTCFILWILKLRNDNLEKQAQALFKSWLVDFEPFKDGEFVESEMGMIPKGWKVGNLFDIAEVLDKYRKPLSGQERYLMDKIYPYYGATSCMDYVDDYLFDGIYTLIGEDGSVVKEDGLPYMQYVWGKLWVNNHAHILQGKNGFSTEMLHVMLSTTNIRHLVTGAVQAKLSQANMQKILVAIPSTNILDEIRPKFDKLYQLIRKNEDESHRLSQLRDTLLPRMMSGKLKINDLTM
jgi:type I restriction enzyme S subunit